MVKNQGKLGAETLKIQGWLLNFVLKNQRRVIFG